MKTIPFWLMCVTGLLLVGPVWGGGKDDTEKTGGTAFRGYDGEQGWPTGKGAQILTEYSVPIYLGLPNKSYRVLGRIVDDRNDGVEVIGKELGGFFTGEKKKLRNIANQARRNGADAVVITDHPEVARQLGVSERELKNTSPLGEGRRRAVLAVKFGLF